MAKAHNSFFASPHGAFIESPHGVRGVTSKWLWACVLKLTGSPTGNQIVKLRLSDMSEEARSAVFPSPANRAQIAIARNGSVLVAGRDAVTGPTTGGRFAVLSRSDLSVKYNLPVTNGSYRPLGIAGYSNGDILVAEGPSTGTARTVFRRFNSDFSTLIWSTTYNFGLSIGANLTMDTSADVAYYPITSGTAHIVSVSPSGVVSNLVNDTAFNLFLSSDKQTLFYGQGVSATAIASLDISSLIQNWSFSSSPTQISAGGQAANGDIFSALSGGTSLVARRHDASGTPVWTTAHTLGFTSAGARWLTAYRNSVYVTSNPSVTGSAYMHKLDAGTGDIIAIAQNDFGLSSLVVG